MDFTNDLIPHYSTADLENVASSFLVEYCPEALKTPMPVPIKKIMTKKLGLSIKHIRITEDFSVYGLTCFNSGKIEVYNGKDDIYFELPVKRGTIIIDPDTSLKRCKGCYFNTLAHETVHWWKHRDYQLLQGVIELRYNVQNSKIIEQCKTDEDWMEWQAESIAPRILMPLDMFILKYQEIIKHSTDNLPEWSIVSELSDFFKVSKKSAQIRLREAHLV
jgi:hypothetical protein